MTLSAAQKQACYRERQKAKLGETAYKAQQAEKCRLARHKDVEATRAKQRVQKQRYRAELKAASSTPECHEPYSARSSLSRAKRRAADALPKSPKKARRVIKALSDEYKIGPESSCGSPLPSNPASSNKLSDEVLQRVINFYQSQDICWTAPGRKDYIMVRRLDGTKVKEQRRYLVTTVGETHALYEKEYPDDKIGLSKFKSLRPEYVLLKDKMPHNVCVCSYHENINLALQGLHHPGFPAHHIELLQQVACNVTDESCMSGQCDACRQRSSPEALSQNLDEDQLSEACKWYQWSRTENGTEKVIRSGTVWDVIQLLSEKLPAFKKHSFIKNQQADFFKKLKTSLRPNHAIIQLDFSENATIHTQDETQSGHWTHPQATLFTSVAWTPDGTFSWGVISDLLSHDKYAAATYIETILDSLQSKMETQLEEVDIISDGAAQHFKQKYMMAFISSLLESRGITVNWHFFATSHGKGAVDGIGGTVKRAVHSAIMTRQYHVQNAQQYAECAQAVTEATTVIYIPSKTIENNKSQLDQTWKDVAAVPAIQSVHCIRTLTPGRVSVSSHSQKEGTEFQLLPVPCDDPGIPVQPCKWYAVRRPGHEHWFIAQALSNEGQTLWKFSFCKQIRRNTNKFTLVCDLETVSRDCVFLEVEAPAPVSSSRTHEMRLSVPDYQNVSRKFAYLQ